MKSNPSSKSSLNKIDQGDIRAVIGHYSMHYFNKFGIKPKVNGKICGSMIKRLLAEHSKDGICRVIDLFFEDAANQNRVMHLPNILSTWSLNQYLPHIKYNTQIYDGADQLNETIW